MKETEANWVTGAEVWGGGDSSYEPGEVTSLTLLSCWEITDKKSNSYQFIEGSMRQAPYLI